MWSKHLNMRPETTKLLGLNICEKLYDIGFAYNTQKHRQPKQKKKKKQWVISN
jgi:hypothetical protein